MPVVAIEAFAGEAGVGEEPGCLSDRLWSIAIRVSKNCVENLAVAKRTF